MGLPGAVATLREDPANKKYARVFDRVGESVATGSTLSTSLAAFPDSFPDAAGASTARRRAGRHAAGQPRPRGDAQLEQGANLKSFLIKKLSYPALVTVAGVGAVAFMILCVIPTFQEMYDESGATLPLITRALVWVGETATNYSLALGGRGGGGGRGGLGVAGAGQPGRDRPRLRPKLPGLGVWFRKIAVLQFMDVLGNLMESGFTLADALVPASDAVSNRHVRAQIRRPARGGPAGRTVQRGAGRGAAGLFPPIVRQLVIVGERTGRLGPVTAQIRTHLRTDVERTTGALLGTIEPVLTVTLAAAIGAILMAVYLPMFDLIGQID